MKMLLLKHFVVSVVVVSEILWLTVDGRRPRSAGGNDENSLSSVEHIWSSTTVAVGDTAVIHCSFDALFQQLKNGDIDWVKESPIEDNDFGNNNSNNNNNNSNNNNNRLNRKRKRNYDEGNIKNTIDNTQQQQQQFDNNYFSHQFNQDTNPVVIATGKTLVVKDKRIRVYRPHNSALSVLIIRRVRKSDAGYYRCNLAGSTTRHKYMVLNVTDSKIEAYTSPAETRVKVDSDVTLWCNATGYPLPIVYWTREDRNRTLPDGSHQYWGNGLFVKAVTEYDTGVYVCYLDNFVQAVVSYKFSIIVEDNPWRLDGYKMRYDSRHWFPASTIEPLPMLGKSYLLMCETRGSPNPQPTITWYKGREPVSSGKNFYIIDDSSDWRQNFVSSTLVIVRYSHQFDGRYVCVANNGFRLRKQKFYVSESKSQLKKHTHDSMDRAKDKESSRNKDQTWSKDIANRGRVAIKSEDAANRKHDLFNKKKHGGFPAISSQTQFPDHRSLLSSSSSSSSPSSSSSSPPTIALSHQRNGGGKLTGSDDDYDDEVTGSGDSKQRDG